MYILRHGQFLNEEITFLGSNFEIIKGPYASMPALHQHVSHLFEAVPTWVDNVLYLISDLCLDPKNQWHEILDLTGKFPFNARYVLNQPLACADPAFDADLAANIIHLYVLGYRVSLRDFLIINNKLAYIGCMRQEDNDSNPSCPFSCDTFAPLHVLTRLAPHFMNAPAELATFFKAVPPCRKSVRLQQTTIRKFLLQG